MLRIIATILELLGTIGLLIAGAIVVVAAFAAWLAFLSLMPIVAGTVIHQFAPQIPPLLTLIAGALTVSALFFLLRYSLPHRSNVGPGKEPKNPTTQILGQVAGGAIGGVLLVLFWNWSAGYLHNDRLDPVGPAMAVMIFYEIAISAILGALRKRRAAADHNDLVRYDT